MDSGAKNSDSRKMREEEATAEFEERDSQWREGRSVYVTPDAYESRSRTRKTETPDEAEFHPYMEREIRYMEDYRQNIEVERKKVEAMKLQMKY